MWERWIYFHLPFLHYSHVGGLWGCRLQNARTDSQISPSESIFQCDTFRQDGSEFFAGWRHELHDSASVLQLHLPPFVFVSSVVRVRDQPPPPHTHAQKKNLLFFFWATLETWQQKSQLNSGTFLFFSTTSPSSSSVLMLNTTTRFQYKCRRKGRNG